MRKAIFQRFAVILSLLVVLSNLSFLYPQVSYAQNLEKAVTIMAVDENGDEVLPLTAISIEEGDTAFDVLQTAGENHDLEISYEDSSFGKMITGIGEVHQTDSKWWSFNVNGLGPDVGASSYEVSNGEHLFFSLTDNFSPSVDVIVSAQNKDGSDVIPESNVTLMKGATLYDALYQAAKANDLSIDASVDDTWFTFINNIGDVKLGPTDFWNIAVNDEPLQVGAVQYQVQPNDTIKLTVESWDEEETPSPGDDGDEEEPIEPEEPEEPMEDPNLPEVTDESVQDNVDSVLDYIENNNIALTYGSEWWIWGIANTNQALPESYIQSVVEKVTELNGEFRNIFDLEKAIIGLSAAGVNASDVAGYNLIDTLINHSLLEKPTINAVIYGLLALDSGQYMVPDEVRNQLVDFILDSEISETGAWAFFGNTPSADITGMALAALAPYKDRTDVRKAIDKAVAYLSETQDENGGFYDNFNGGYASESAAQVIIGLDSIGIDPMGEQFTKSEGNLVQFLLSFAKEDGGFSHLLEEGKSNPVATQQALLALASLQTEGFVYQFELSIGGIEPPVLEPKPVPNPDPEVPVDEDELTDSPNNNNQGDSTNTEKNEGTNTNLDTNKTSNESKKVSEGEKLPDTATNTANIMLIGFVLILVGALVFFIYRKKALK